MAVWPPTVMVTLCLVEPEALVGSSQITSWCDQDCGMAAQTLEPMRTWLSKSLAPKEVPVSVMRVPPSVGPGNGVSPQPPRLPPLQEPTGLWHDCVDPWWRVRKACRHGIGLPCVRLR